MKNKTELRLTRYGLPGLSGKVYGAIDAGAAEIDVFFDDILFWSEEDFSCYRRQLGVAAAYVVQEYQTARRKIAVNILTDVLFGEQNIDKQFPLCWRCPCVQCVPDTKLFEAATGSPWIPPLAVCKKSFAEYGAANIILQAICPGAEHSDIGAEEWIDLMQIAARSEL